MKVNYCTNCMKLLAEDAAGPCPRCGFDPEASPQPAEALRRNTILHGKYLVGRVLGRGGFGITYVGLDLTLELKVAIKEYYPAGAAMRGQDHSSLVWHSSQLPQEQRQDVYESFLREARKMAKIDRIPSVVRVRETFLENGTAYIVMDYVEGETLKDRLARQGVMDWAECYRLLRPLLVDLEQVHQQGIIHRDISPDNIMVRPDGTVCLLDLGAAKDMTAERNGVSQLVTKKSFSPLEQYGENGAIGPWTDVYALCATLYFCIQGRTIPAAPERVGKEQLSFAPPPTMEPMPMEFADVLRRGLAVTAETRIRTVAELTEQLDRAVENDRLAKQRKQHPAETGGAGADTPKPSAGKKRWKLAAAAAAAVVAVCALALGLFLTREKEPLTVVRLGANNSNMLNDGGFLMLDDYVYFLGSDQTLYQCPFDEEEQSFVVENRTALAAGASYLCRSEEYIYFSSDDGQPAICRMGLDGSELTQICQPQDPVILLQYALLSDESEMLYFICYGDQTETLYRYDLHAGEIEELMTDVLWYNLNGGSIYATAFTEDTLVLQRTDLNGQNPETLDTDALYSFGFTTDEELYLYSEAQQDLIRMDLDGNVLGAMGITMDTSHYCMAYLDGWVYYVSAEDQNIHRVCREGKNTDEVFLDGYSAVSIAEMDSWLWLLAYRRTENYTSYYPETAYGTYLAYTGGDKVVHLTENEPELTGYERPAEEEFVWKNWDNEGTALVLTGYTGPATRIIVPETVGGKQVKAIGAEAFLGSDLEAVILPQGLRFIRARAFADCSKLEYVQLPDSLLWIREEAFHRCEALTGITLPEGLDEIGSYAFADSGLTEVFLPSSVEQIGEGALRCPALRSIELGEGCENFTLRDGVLFQGSTLLACPAGMEGEYAVPEGVTAIAPYAFACCGLTGITLPDTLETVGRNAFYTCRELREVRFANRAVEFEGQAFMMCDALSQVTLHPDSICPEDLGEGVQVAYYEPAEDQPAGEGTDAAADAPADSAAGEPADE